jgi:hypothetical protein
MLPSIRQLILGLLAKIILEVVSFHVYASLPTLLLFLNAFWKWFSVKVFSTAYDSVSITSIATKWRPFSFLFNRGNKEK